jgi:hypothetical protein
MMRDDELDRLAHLRHLQTYAELLKETKDMNDVQDIHPIPTPDELAERRRIREAQNDRYRDLWRDGIPGVIADEPREPRRITKRSTIWDLWASAICVVLIMLVMYASVRSCTAHAEGVYQVYLVDEQELGNGFKACIYDEGVTITVRDSQLCPLSITI